MMNGFIPNSLNNSHPNTNNNHNQHPVAVGAVVPVVVAQQPAPAPLMNGVIPNQNEHHPPPPLPQALPQIVHYIPQQQFIPNGNVIQLAPSPQPPGQAAIYMARAPGHPLIRMVHQNGSIPVHNQPSLQQAPQIHQMAPRARMIRLTPNGTYATTLSHPMIMAPGSAVGAGSGAANTTLIMTKAPPPRCILCCLACCGLESLWFNPNFSFSRVIALICNILVDLLMILCLLSTNWLTTIKYRQGLWQYCIDPDSPRPLPFGLDDHDGCHWGRNAAYIKLSGFFAVACFVLALIATILTSFGLSSRDPNKKYTFYRFALYINLGALLAIIVSLTLYPAFFYSELHHTNMVPANRPHWYFGWAYGVGWGAAIFLVGAILLLVCDKETEEIYYQERTIHVHSGNHLPTPHHNNINHQQLHPSIKA